MLPLVYLKSFALLSTDHCILLPRSSCRSWLITTLNRGGLCFSVIYELVGFRLLSFKFYSSGSVVIQPHQDLTLDT